MTITFPRNDLFDGVDFEYEDCIFEPMVRQNVSRQENGSPIAVDLGEPIWVATYVTGPIEDPVGFEAKLNSLDGMINTFYGGDLRRQYPKQYPDGNFVEVGTAIHTLGGDNKSIRIKGLPATFQVSVGDYFSFDYGTGERALHQAMEAVTAVGGVTPLFEIRPHLFPGAAVDDVVTFKKPRAIMKLESVSRSKRDGIFGGVTFQAYQVP